MRIRLRSRLRSVTVALTLFVAALPVGDWTLCLGSHGHLALEIADTVCAEPPAPQRHAADPTPCSDCHDCRDVSLQIATGVWKLDATVASIDAAEALPLLLPAPAVATDRHPDRAFAFPPEPRSTRTAILRC